MKLIGLTSSSTENRTFVNTAYHSCLKQKGVGTVGLPLFSIPNREIVTPEDFEAQHKEHIEGLANKLDGFVFTGGIDINPLSFDEENYAASNCDNERDMMELALIKAAIAAGKPVMGICRGHQLIGQHLGWSFFQQDLSVMKIDELHDGNDRSFKERQEPSHFVTTLGEFRDYVREKTNLHELSKMKVNSFHHQGFILEPDGKIPSRIKTSAQFKQWFDETVHAYEEMNAVKLLTTTNMVIEGVEKPENKLVTWQAHPEEYGVQSLMIRYWLDKYVLV